MKFGCNFHAGSKADALTRIKGAVSLPSPVAQLAVAAVTALGGNPSNVKVSVAGEEKPGTGVNAIAISVAA
jgi:hypothetical protein